MRGEMLVSFKGCAVGVEAGAAAGMLDAGEAEPCPTKEGGGGVGAVAVMFVTLVISLSQNSTLSC